MSNDATDGFGEEQTRALAEASERITADANPFHDAELVIYTADEEFAQEETSHPNLKELGLVSWSLWARWEDDGVEIPIVGEASWHMWYSLSAENFHPDPADPVSDAFIDAIVEMHDGHGDTMAISQETWDETRDIEKYIIHLTRSAFLKMDNPEPALLIDYCHQERGVGRYAE